MYQQYCFVLAWTLAYEICHAINFPRLSGSILQNTLPNEHIFHSIYDLLHAGNSWEKATCGYIIDSFVTTEDHMLPLWSVQICEWAPKDKNNVNSYEAGLVPMTWVHRWFRQET
jgi:hypothetical protein